MKTRDQVVPRHSPAMWTLMATLGASGVLLLGTVAWNAWEYRADIARWLKI